jgi:hypothetical protein
MYYNHQEVFAFIFRFIIHLKFLYFKIFNDLLLVIFYFLKTLIPYYFIIKKNGFIEFYFDFK